MAEILKTLRAIAEAPTMSEAWEPAARYYASLGFRHVNYGYTRFLFKKSMGDPDDALFLTTADAAYAQSYFRGGFFARTPAYKWAQSHEGACTWTWIREAALSGQLTPEEMETLKINQAAGIVAGITISFPTANSRSKGAMGMIADPGLSHIDVDRIFAEHYDSLMSVANMMHLKITQFPVFNRKRALTQRQREALEWVADGKTSQDIAILMNVSAAMVEKHLRLAREALDVGTSAQAVAKAALLNLIFQLPTRPLLLQ